MTPATLQAMRRILRRAIRSDRWVLQQSMASQDREWVAGYRWAIASVRAAIRKEKRREC